MLPLVLVPSSGPCDGGNRVSRRRVLTTSSRWRVPRHDAVAGPHVLWRGYATVCERFLPALLYSLSSTPRWTLLTKGSLPTSPCVGVGVGVAGTAHVSHAIDGIRHGKPVVDAALGFVVQFSYTFLFGLYGSFVFLTTGACLDIVLLHLLLHFQSLCRCPCFRSRSRCCCRCCCCFDYRGDPCVAVR